MPRSLAVMVQETVFLHPGITFRDIVKSLLTPSKNSAVVSSTDGFHVFATNSYYRYHDSVVAMFNTGKLSISQTLDLLKSGACEYQNIEIAKSLFADVQPVLVHHLCLISPDKSTKDLLQQLHTGTQLLPTDVYSILLPRYGVKLYFDREVFNDYASGQINETELFERTVYQEMFHLMVEPEDENCAVVYRLHNNKYIPTGSYDAPTLGFNRINAKKFIRSSKVFANL